MFRLTVVAERIGDMGPFRIAFVELGIGIAMSVYLPVHLFQIRQQFTAAGVDAEAAHAGSEAAAVALRRNRVER